MENISKKVLETCDDKHIVELVKLCRHNKLYNLGVVLSEFFSKKFPYNIVIQEENAIMSYYTNKQAESYEMFQKILDRCVLTESNSQKYIHNQHFSIKSIQTKFIHYNHNKVQKILKRKKNDFPLVTLTITTCKRFNLLEQTLNSFINCCKDIDKIDKWFCIDDNSSEEDRNKMKKLYPFFTFYFKSLEEKGHPRSMNIIKNKVKTPYIFHLEDDWRFFNQRFYISECMEVLGQDRKIGQCLINKNYGEIGENKIVGGIFKTTPTGLRYYIHEFCSTENEKKIFSEKYGTGPSCNYWPHFSFRPSLIRKSVLDDLGDFNEYISHFEMDYSRKYSNKGYISAFLESIYCTHIGRLTSQMNDKTILNAYQLNNEEQFTGKENILDKNKEATTVVDNPDNKYIKIKTFVINLNKRHDRMEKFIELNEPKFLFYKRYPAIDGSKLTPNLQLQKIFENNDYNMHQGMVGCALSHISLYIQLLNDNDNEAYCILEDDIQFVPDFKNKLISCISNLSKTDWDLFYLGHSLRKEYIDENVYSKTLQPRIGQMSVNESLKKSMGGTIGYIITKKGAEKLLEFINQTGMTNGIDTIQQKSGHILNIFYCYPHLIYSECVTPEKSVDSNIQYNYESLTLSLGSCINEEVKNHKKIIKVTNYDIAVKLAQNITHNFYYYTENLEEITYIKNICKYHYYTFENKVIFVCGDNKDRYFHRFKKNGIWDIKEAIQYKTSI